MYVKMVNTTKSSVNISNVSIKPPFRFRKGQPGTIPVLSTPNGNYSSWKEILEGYPMPQLVVATLMPFRDVIIHDGIVAPFGVCLSRNMSEQSKQIYLEAKVNCNLHYGL